MGEWAGVPAILAELHELREENAGLREILHHAYAWMAPDGCDCGTDEPGSCALCETERVLEIATRRAGRAT